MAFSALAIPVDAFAQEDAIESAAELNAKGLAALERKEYERAVRLFSEAIDVAPLNILYLNLGRTYARWGRCEEAREAYDEVPDAEAVEVPPRDQVLETLYQYRLELDEQCAPEESDETVVETTPIERPRAEEPMSLRPIAWALLGTGAAAIGTGLLIDRLVLKAHESNDDEDAFNRTRSINQIVVIGGGLSVVAGAILWFLEPSDGATAVRPMLGADRLGLAWEVRW